jgi:hypothetical protein
VNEAAKELAGMPGKKENELKQEDVNALDHQLKECGLPI